MIGIHFGMSIAVLAQPIPEVETGRTAETISSWRNSAPADGPFCYANCDQSTGTPLLTANDFICFVNHFVAGHSYSNCDGVGGLVGAEDFICFLGAFNVGCS